MSVLIKSLDKPDHCLRCPVKGIDDECLLQSEAANADYESWEDQMANCPLIPVPKHGRLIDADKLGIRDAEKQAYEAYLREKGEDFIEEPIIEYHRGYLEGLTHASGLVRFAPTIIPVSEEGE